MYGAEKSMPTLRLIARSDLERMLFRQRQNPYRPSCGMRPLFAVNGELGPRNSVWSDVYDLAAEGFL